MLLSELFAGTDARVPASAGKLDVRALAVDSRTVTPGALFAAFPGTATDGARFAAQAVEKGAVAVLAPSELQLPVPTITAPDARRAFALAAARFHGEPSRKLKLLGVTGTNGKTTTTYLCEQLCGEPAGLLGTVEVRWPGHSAPATHTTPESHELQAALAQMVAAGARVAAIEVSSHALEQRRADGCTFAAAAFTNLTRDHLDYHGTMDAYFAAKARLFRTLLGDAPAVLNLDDAKVAQLAGELHGAIGFTVREATGAALRATNIASGLDGLTFELRYRGEKHLVRSPLLGLHNVENLLAATGLLLGAGLPLERIVARAAQATGAPGRLERVPDARGRVVLVDYAHTDDALARVLDAVKAAAGAARVLCVFGCGGDRDKGKRPLMARAASHRADLVIATSDNPRTEDPQAILRDVEAGLQGRALTAAEAREGHAGWCSVADRAEAIALAIACARAGDAVLIAGKGHEPYQIVGATKRPFDDRKVAAEALK